MVPVTIPDKLFFAIRKRDNMVYPVDAFDKKAVESAKTWGKTYNLQEKKYEECESFECENGKFKVNLTSAPKGSSQGGKLSFSEVTITTPDGNSYLIGANTECLFNLIKNSTVVRGEVDVPVYVGRVGGNLALITKDMPEYDEYVENKTREKEVKSVTKNYKPGDIVETKTLKQLYFGEAWRNYTYEVNQTEGPWREYDVDILLYHNPVKVYILKNITDYNTIEKVKKTEWFYDFEIFTSKPKRHICGHEEVNLKKILSNQPKARTYSRITRNSITFDPPVKLDKEEIISAITEKIKLDYEGNFNLNFNVMIV